jgi:uncharacterized membrane protein
MYFCPDYVVCRDTRADLVLISAGFDSGVVLFGRFLSWLISLFRRQTQALVTSAATV